MQRYGLPTANPDPGPESWGSPRCPFVDRADSTGHRAARQARLVAPCPPAQDPPPQMNAPHQPPPSPASANGPSTEQRRRRPLPRGDAGPATQAASSSSSAPEAERNGAQAEAQARRQRQLDIEDARRRESLAPPGTIRTWREEVVYYDERVRQRELQQGGGPPPVAFSSGFCSVTGEPILGLRQGLAARSDQQTPGEFPSTAQPGRGGPRDAQQQSLRRDNPWANYKGPATNRKDQRSSFARAD